MFKEVFRGKAGINQQELVRRVQWYIKIRWIYLLVIATGGILSQYLLTGLTTTVMWTIFIVSGAFLINGVFYVLAQQKQDSQRYFIALALAQIVLDAIIVTYAIYIYGGYQSRLVALYVIPIMISSVLFGRLAIYFSTILSIGLYNLALLLEYRQRVALDATEQILVTSPGNVYAVMFFYSTVLVILAVIASFLARQVKSHEEELAKEEVISLTSHQLRTPATAIKNILSVLLDNYVGELSPEQRGLLRRAYDENERELHLVETMLDVATADSKQLELAVERADLKALIERTVELHQPNLASRGQKIKIDIPQETVRWHVDTQKMYMVLDNLISNASKYSPPESTILVAAKIKPKSKQLQITVKDEGVGMHKEDLERIFHKHVRLDNPTTLSVTGSGLGLYLTKRMVNLHRGIINVSSEPRKGTEFVVIIPNLKPDK